MTSIYPLRSIRSYVLRQGRITEAQQRALAEGWSQYGLAAQKIPYDLKALFGREAPRVLEIGFGMGNTLVSMAQSYPEMDFIGAEVHQPGIGHCLDMAQKAGVNNLKVYHGDANLLLESLIPNHSLDKVLLLFPDPWPKRKHHKRRLVQPSFVNLIADKLKCHGFFHLATDWQPYANHMLTVLENSPKLSNHFGKGHFAPHAFERFQTKFEERGKKLGHTIFDLVFESVVS